MKKRNILIRTGLSLTLAAVLLAGCGGLHSAAYNGNLKKVRNLVEKDHVDMNTFDRYGWTPMMWASYYNFDEVVAYLVSKGANPNMQSTYKYGSIEKGSTALHIASYYGFANVARPLVAHGANPNIKNVQGDSPLMIAERYAFNEMLALFGKAPVPAFKPGGGGRQTVVLRDGTKIVGQITAQTRDSVVIRTASGGQTISKDNIKEIRYK